VRGALGVVERVRGADELPDPPSDDDASDPDKPLAFAY